MNIECKIGTMLLPHIVVIVCADRSANVPADALVFLVLKWLSRHSAIAMQQQTQSVGGNMALQEQQAHLPIHLCFGCTRDSHLRLVAD